MTEQRAALDDSEFIDALLNLVIPPSVDGNLPGAGTLGLAPASLKGVGEPVRVWAVRETE